MNNLLSALYTDKSKNNSNNMNNDDAINISSDESDEEPVDQNRHQNHGKDDDNNPIIIPGYQSFTKEFPIQASIAAGNNSVRFPKELTVSKRVLGGDELGEPSISIDGHELASSRELNSRTVGPSKKRKYDQHDYDHDNRYTPNGRTGSYASPKSSKQYKREYALQRSPITFKHVGGLDKILRDLCELLLHIKHPSVSTHFGLPPPHGLLLCGPPGTGKTLLAQAIAGVC